MPLYEYICTECGTKFEELVSLTATPNPPCTKCGSSRTEKEISVVFSKGASSSSCGTSGFS